MNPSRLVTVTGASGFIGRHLTRTLLEAGYDVRGVSRRVAMLAPKVDPFPVEDLLDQATLAQAFAGTHAVVHLAARVHLPGRTTAEQREHARVNAAGTKAVAHAAVAAGATRVLFMSSVAAVAGPGLTHLTEATAPAPATAYGRSKLNAERVLLEVCANTACDAVVLRPPLVYGPEMPGNPRTLFRLISRGIPIPSPRPSARRSVVFVGNLCAAVLCGLSARDIGGSAFFVRDLEDHTIDEWCSLIGAALGREPRLVPVPQTLVRFAGFTGDLMSSLVPHPFTMENVRRFTESLTVDDAPLRRQTGYTSPWSATDALASTAAWFRTWRADR